MQRRDGSYRRAVNYVTAVNNGHHNKVSYVVRSCDFFTIALPPLND